MALFIGAEELRLGLVILSHSFGCKWKQKLFVSWGERARLFWICNACKLKTITILILSSCVRRLVRFLRPRDKHLPSSGIWRCNCIQMRNLPLGKCMKLPHYLESCANYSCALFSCSLAMPACAQKMDGRGNRHVAFVHNAILGRSKQNQFKH